MADVQHQKIAVLWRGDREVRRAATPQNNRFYRVFEELAALGIDASLRFMTTTSPTRCAINSWRLMVCSCGLIRSMKGRPDLCSTRCCVT